MIGVAKERRVRGRVEWPGGARLAVLISYDYHADAGLTPGAKVSYRDLSDRQYELYDGLRRILELHERYEIPSTYRIPGETVERHPDAVREIYRHGHEIGGHGYRHEDVTTLTREEEKGLVQRTLAAIERVTGSKPSGWRSSFSQPSDNTVEILTESGFTWHSDFFDDDFPYLLEGEKGKLLEIPYHWATGDSSLFNWPHLHPYGNPEDALGYWQDEFDFLYAESKSSPRMLVFSWQPFSIGRPSRAAALEKLCRYMKEHNGLWFARFDDVANWWLKQGY
jgi:peptidoglycan/xylan/chitin deacetylase (PgdA/CDA1 family)